MDVPAGLPWELVIVDNNSTDATAAVAERFTATAPVPVRYAFEPLQGLSHARNRALDVATGSIIAFTDDDCRVTPDWLAVIAREFAQDETLHLLTGRVELFNPNDRAITVRTERQRTELSGSPRLVQELAAGCNLVLRRASADDVGGFDPRFTTPGLLPSGDDLDFVYRVARRPGRVVYAPDLVVYHDHGRASDAQVDALRKSYVQGRGGFYAKHMLAGDRAVARMAYWEARALLSGAWSQRGNLHVLAWLLRGAALFCRHARAPAHSNLKPMPSPGSGSA